MNAKAKAGVMLWWVLLFAVLGMWLNIYYYFGGEPVENDVWKITFYCACEKCCGKWADGQFANGQMCKSYPHNSIACNVLPFGTKVVIDGLGEYVVRDRGSKKYFDNQKHIDVYMENHEQARRRGVLYKPVTVVIKEGDRKIDYLYQTGGGA